MSMPNSVCVLVPTKNRKELLKKALHSIEVQTVLPDEIIIVNDGSTDGTSEYIRAFSSQTFLPHVQIIEKHKSEGVNSARNDGIQLSHSEWIMFLDDDDELVPDAVSMAKQKSSILSREYALFYFNTLTRTDNGEFVGGFQFSSGQAYYDPTYEEVMIKFGLKGDCKPLFRRPLFKNPEYVFPVEVNGFESHIIRKIARDGHKVRYYCEISTVMNLHTNFEHLSFSAAAKNPSIFMYLHEKELQEHQDFYKTHPVQLKDKYLTIAKLALRSRKYGTACKYILKRVLG